MIKLIAIVILAILYVVRFVYIVKEDSKQRKAIYKAFNNKQEK